MCFKQNGAISPSRSKLMKLGERFAYRGSNISSTERDVNIRIGKAWTVIDWLSTIWKSDFSDEINRGFLQAVDVSVLLYDCTSGTLKKESAACSFELILRATPYKTTIVRLLTSHLINHSSKTNKKLCVIGCEVKTNSQLRDSHGLLQQSWWTNKFMSPVRTVEDVETTFQESQPTVKESVQSALLDAAAAVTDDDDDDKLICLSYGAQLGLPQWLDKRHFFLHSPSPENSFLHLQKVGKGKKFISYICTVLVYNSYLIQ